MIRFPFIVAGLLFYLAMMSFTDTATNKVSVKLTMLPTTNAEAIIIRIDVKNLSAQPIRVLENRWWDYKWGNIKSLGNYIIEISKRIDKTYKLFPPTADIDPGIREEKYTVIRKYDSIIDTIRIFCSDFNRNAFPEGDYRIRVSFNANQWSSSEMNHSEWLAFKIN